MPKVSARAILFDLDGTLIDTLDMILRGLRDTYERFDGTSPEPSTIRKLIGLPLSSQVMAFAEKIGTDRELADRVAFAQDRFAAYSHLETIFPHTLEILKRCADCGLTRAIVTSKTATEFQAFLARNRWAEQLDALVCSSDVRHGKPAPDSAVAAMQKLGVEPHETILVGDSIFDIQCGNSAGCTTWGVGYGACSLEDLGAAGAKSVFQTQTELLAAITNQVLKPTCPAKS